MLQQNGVYRRAFKIEKPIDRQAKTKSRSPKNASQTVETSWQQPQTDEKVLAGSDIRRLYKVNVRKSQNPLY